VGGGDEAISAPRRSGVFARQFGGGGAQVVGEGVEIRGRGEGQLGFDGERQQARAFCGGVLPHPGHVAHHGRGGGDQVVGGVAVLGLDGFRIGRRLHQGGVEDVALGRDEQVFDESALAPLAGGPDQTRRLEGAKVITDLLTRHAKLLRETGGGSRLGQG
jgi:hypothetical protein